MAKHFKRELCLDAIEETEERVDCLKEQYESLDIKKPAIFKHKETVDVAQAEKDIEEAQEEWDNLGSAVHGVLITPIKVDPISCEEVLHYFRSKDMHAYMKNIKPVKQRKGFDAVRHWITGPPKLHENLIPDRNLFFAIAMCPFITSEDVHMRVLQTLYKALTYTDKDCPRYGPHWEEIGFQGIDPGTDLRGVGFLGLIHLLYLALNPNTSALAREITQLSKTKNQDFPFCTMGINMTRIVLEAMREEVLNRECNGKMDVFQVTNDFYAGVFLRLQYIWTEQKKTIMDSGYVIRDLSSFAKKHSTVILKDFTEYVKRKKNSSMRDITRSRINKDVGVVIKV